MHERMGQSGSSTFANDLPSLTNERMARFAATIESREIEVVSFDIFDTLLTRRFFEPKDLFAYVGVDPELEQYLGGWNFAGDRADAERSVRLRFKELGQRLDPTLDDIYAELIRLSGITKEAAAIVKQREIDTEIACVRPRPALKQLYDYAIRLGKKVILVSDMYLPVWVLEKMLENIGCKGPHTLYHSAQCGFTKKHGTIFPHIERELAISPDRFLHIGDNLNSDVRQAESAGWNALLVHDYPRMLADREANSLAGLLPKFSASPGLPNHATRLNYALVMEKAFANVLHVGDADEELDAKKLGYVALGPFALSLVLWARRTSQQKGIERIAWLARDGFLLEKVARLVDETAGSDAQSLYLPISRKMLTPYFVHQRNGIERILQIGFSPEMTVGQFVEQRFGSEGVAIVQSATGTDYERFSLCFMRDQYHHVAKILREHIEDLKIATLDRFNALKEFYRDKLGAGVKTAIFDVGRKGTFQSALSSLTGHRLHGFYAVNSYAIQSNAPGRTYDSYLGIIDPLVREKNPDTIIYEALLSERGGSYLGIEQNGELIRAQKATNPEEEEFFAGLHSGALEFVNDAIAMHGARISELEQEPFYASYALENWQDSNSAVKLLSSIRHEDSISTVVPRTLGEYLAAESVIGDRPQFPLKSADQRRVAIYCPAITRIRGGAERIAARLANHLHRCGFEVLVFSSGGKHTTLTPVYDLAPGIHVRNVNTREPEEMSDLIKAFAPDAALVLASGPVIINVSKALLDCGIPYMLSERASPDASMRVYWKAYEPEDYFTIYECASTISVQCRGFRDIFPSEIQRRISVLPNPIKMVEPSRVEREKTILCAARVWFEQKRQDILLRAFAKIADKYPEWNLKFFGEPYGDDARRLDELAQKLGVSRQVEIQPATPDIASQFERSSVFVLPSSFEGFPNSLAEALATGTPAIGFKSCPGVNELIVDGENGLLVDDTDLASLSNSKNDKVVAFTEDQIAKRLAVSLDAMMGDGHLRENASVQAIELIREYDAERVLELWTKEVERLCDQDGTLFQGQRVAAVEAITASRATSVEAAGQLLSGQDERSSEIDAHRQECERAIQQITQSSLIVRMKQAVRVARGHKSMSGWELFDSELKPNGNVMLTAPSDFNESAYLAENSDVDDAVIAGEFQSGYVHYLRHGFAEGRKRPSRNH